MQKQKWRRRTHGTKNQKGKAFQIPTESQQAMKHNLPKIKVPLNYPTGRKVLYSMHDVPTTNLPTEATYIQEPNPPNFEERVQHFMQMYHGGQTIPPIMYHTNPDGTILILDGRARLEAFRRLQVSHIPAVENFSLGGIGKAMAKVGGNVKLGAKNFVSSAMGKTPAPPKEYRARGWRKDVASGKIPPPPKVHTSIGAALGSGARNITISANESRKDLSSSFAKTRSIGRELSYRMEGNVQAAEQVKGERIAEERAQKATKFHEVATKYVETPKAEKPVNVFVKGTTSEIDLSKKPFSDVIKGTVKNEIKQHEAKKARKAQKLVAKRTKEAFNPHKAKIYAKEAMVEAKEIQQN